LLAVPVLPMATTGFLPSPGRTAGLATSKWTLESDTCLLFEGMGKTYQRFRGGDDWLTTGLRQSIRVSDVEVDLCGELGHMLLCRRQGVKTY
jgi:hypothetical protein